MSDPRDRLEALLNLYWLRPETALFRALDFRALDGIDFVPPVLELGCGDGALSFLRAGGRFDPAFDVYKQTTALDAFYENADIYDAYDADQKAPNILSKPTYRIHTGLDHKPNLLKKALGTGLYEETVEADANGSLPLPDASYQTVFSNILYWLTDHRSALAEIRRVLKPGGRAILHVPNETFRDYSFYQRLYVSTGDPRWEWLKLIDRGRSESIKLCQSREAWVDDFSQAGLGVTHHVQYLSKLALEIWDIGLRPVSPFLIEMANALGDGKRAEIKRKWVEGMIPLVWPLCGSGLRNSNPAGFHLFVLKHI